MESGPGRIPVDGRSGVPFWIYSDSGVGLALKHGNNHSAGASMQNSNHNQVHFNLLSCLPGSRCLEAGCW